MAESRYVYRMTEWRHGFDRPRVRYGTEHSARAIAKAVAQYNTSLAEGERWLRENRPDEPCACIAPSRLHIERLWIVQADDVTADFL